MKAKGKSAVQDYFEQYPDTKILFETTDGQLFLDHYFAKLHGDTLKEGKKEIETYKNALHLEVEAEAVK